MTCTKCTTPTAEGIALCIDCVLKLEAILDNAPDLLADAEAWARRVTEPQPLPWADDGDYTPTSRHRYPTTTGAGTDQQRQGGPSITRDERVAAAMLREHSTTTYGVPDDCTCVPDHTRAALANTHVVHRADCATNRGPRVPQTGPR